MRSVELLLSVSLMPACCDSAHRMLVLFASDYYRMSVAG
jgi:hypothetical protein